MSFVLTDEQELLRRTVREFAQGPIRRSAQKADLECALDKENVKRLAQLGLLGVLVDEEQGGAGGDVVLLALACEELGAACASTAAFVAVTNAWVSGMVARHGSSQAREQWLPRLLSGEALGTFAVHEDAVGADPYRIRTALHPPDDGDGPGVLSGTKDLVLLWDLAHVVVTAVRERNGNGDRRVGLWLVPTDRGGVRWGGDDPKLGLRALRTAPLYLVRARMEESERLARGEDVVPIIRRARQVLTIAGAAAAVGASRSALEGSVEFAKEREQFGSPIARYEAIQHKVADMLVAVEGARSSVLRAASLLDRDDDASVAVEAANVQTFETTRTATRTAIRLHGGAGFMRDLPIERYARDVRTLAVLGRSSEVSKSLVGMHALHVDG